MATGPPPVSGHAADPVQIVALYDLLLRAHPSPVVEMLRVRP